jgi:hypothetical protein
MPEPAGAPATEEAEDTLTVLLQSAATIDGNGTIANVDGYKGPITVEVKNTGGGTSTLNLEGSFDGSTWYTAGFQQFDATATLARSVTAISVTATTFAHAYSFLDPYKLVRARMSASSSGPGPVLTATLRAYPV